MSFFVIMTKFNYEFSTDLFEIFWLCLNIHLILYVKHQKCYFRAQILEFYCYKLEAQAQAQRHKLQAQAQA